MKNLQDMPFRGKDNIFTYLEEKLSLSNLTEQERDAYEEELKIARDNQATFDYAIQRAEAQGMEEGIAKGMLKAVRKLLNKGKSQQEIIDLLDVDPSIFAQI